MQLVKAGMHAAASFTMPQHEATQADQAQDLQVTTCLNIAGVDPHLQFSDQPIRP